MTRNLRPYIELIRQNRNFRLLWLSQVISNFGDWFGILAVYTLIQRYSDSEFLLGLIIVVKMLSLAVFSPLAGHITDRFNRRRLMVWCDLLRGIIVLGFLLIVSLQTLWLAYLLTALQMMLAAVFQPAKTASIPNVTTSEELVHANVLSAATWSVIFAVGMGLGGVATAALGTDTVFVINSITYIYSGWVIWLAAVPQEGMSAEEFERTRNPLTGIREGFVYLKRNRRVFRPVLAKGFMTSCLGALVYLLIIIAEDVLLMGSVGLGLLYGARGIGTGIGPVVGRRIFSRESGWIRAMGLCMICCGLFYLPLAFSGSLAVMLVLVCCAHMCSGAIWVMSTVLLQRRARDTYRGRAFSTDWLLFTLSQSVSVTIASLLLELNLLSIRETTALFAVLLVGAGFFWLVRVTPGEERELHSEAVNQSGYEPGKRTDGGDEEELPPVQSVPRTGEDQRI